VNLLAFYSDIEIVAATGFSPFFAYEHWTLTI